MSPDSAAHPMTAASWFLLGTIAGALAMLAIAAFVMAAAKEPAGPPKSATVLPFPSRLRNVDSAAPVDERGRWT